jgi:short-subunit dehydrogenase
MSTRSLTGAVVAVIGATGGLGGEVVHLLRGRGAVLVLAGPHRDRLNTLAAHVGPDYCRVAVCDIRDASAGDVIAEAAAPLGGLDGVINAAGVVGFGSLLETADDIIEELFLINAMGPLWMMKRVAPQLRVSKGFVVNISAVVAETPLPNMAVYSATKAALSAADAALAREFRRIGITVCDVRPPHTETELSAHPITGVAPSLPAGLTPARVAEVIVAAIEAGSTTVSANEFAQ